MARADHNRNPKLRQRIAEIERELGRVDGTIDDLSKAVRRPDDRAAARRLQELAEAQPRAGAPASPGTPPVAPPPGGGLLPGMEARPPARPTPDGTGDGALPKLAPDKRFASYFVTGSLHSVRPLRQERRVQRNKAIMMTIFAVIVLFMVISLLMRVR